MYGGVIHMTDSIPKADLKLQLGINLSSLALYDGVIHMSRFNFDIGLETFN